VRWGYRFGFQGQEKDDEIHGATGTSYNYEYRMHDPRIGRFLSIDPLAAKYSHQTPYAFSSNRVIDRVEMEGLEDVRFDVAERGYWTQAKQLYPGDFDKQADHVIKCRGQAALGGLIGATVGIGLVAAPEIIALARAYPLTTIWLGGTAANAVDPDPTPKDYTPMIPGDEILGKFIGNAFRGLKNINPQFANAGFKALGYDAPFDELKPIVDFAIQKEEQFVRVFSSQVGNKEGGWLMKAGDIAGLTPGQIKDRFALDYVPDMMVDVCVPAATTLRAGTAAARPGVGAGGGTQFLTERLPSGSFSNARAIGECAP
jgi:RHS repeat-associated protein